MPGKVHVPATMGGSSSRLTMPPAERSADKAQDNGCPPLQWHLCASKATTDPPCPTSGSEEAFLKSGCAALTATTRAGMLLAAPTPSQESPLRLCTRCRAVAGVDPHHCRPSQYQNLFKVSSQILISTGTSELTQTCLYCFSLFPFIVKTPGSDTVRRELPALLLCTRKGFVPRGAGGRTAPACSGSSASRAGWLRATQRCQQEPQAGSKITESQNL